MSAILDLGILNWMYLNTMKGKRKKSFYFNDKSKCSTSLQITSNKGKTTTTLNSSMKLIRHASAATILTNIEISFGKP